MTSKQKTYGLVLPKKDLKTALLRPTAFSQDSDDDDGNKTVINPKTEPKGNYLKKQDQLDIEKALADDPHCFDYDEVYDREHVKKDRLKSKLEKDYKPKYIGSLMVAAEAKKKDRERVMEKQLQKEREAEGNKYDDKESFVTRTYKEKLETRKEEERERQKQVLEELRESQGDKGYSAFYRYIFDQKVGQGSTISENVIRDKSIETSKDMKKDNGPYSLNDKGRKRNKPSSSNGTKHMKKRSESSSSEERNSHCSKKSMDDSRDKNRKDYVGRKSLSIRYEGQNNDGRRYIRTRSRSDSEEETDYQNKSDKNKTCSKKKSLCVPVAGESSNDRSWLTDNKDIEHMDSTDDRSSPKNNLSSKMTEVSNVVLQSGTDKYTKRNIGTALNDAKARYLARKAETPVRPIICRK